MKTPIAETQYNIGINSRLNNQQPFISPLFPPTESSNDGRTAEQPSESLSSLTSMVKDINAKTKTKTKAKTKPIEETKILHLGAWPDKQSAASAKQADIQRIFGNHLNEKTIYECHLEDDQNYRQHLEDPTTTWRIGDANEAAPPPRNKAAFKQVAIPEPVAKPARQRGSQKKPRITFSPKKLQEIQAKAAAQARSAKKLKRQKQAKTPISPTIVLERVSANTPGEEIKQTKTVDAATSTTIDREEETKREDTNDDQEIVVISDDDGATTVKIENDDVAEDHHNDDQERTQKHQRRVTNQIANTPPCVGEVSIQTDEPAADPIPFGVSVENQESGPAQSSSCCVPTIAEPQQHQQYILSSEVAALIFQQHQPAQQITTAAAATEPQQFFTTVVENIDWNNLTLAMDPSQVPAVQRQNKAGEESSIVQQAATASNVPTAAPETIFTPVGAVANANIQGQNINIQQQQNVTSVSLGQTNQQPGSQNQHQLPAYPGYQQQLHYAFNMPYVTTHQHPGQNAIPDIATAFQNNGFQLSQNKVANPAIANYHHQQHSDLSKQIQNAESHYTEVRDMAIKDAIFGRQPPPAHHHQKPTEKPARLGGPTPRAPTPAKNHPPPSNHGGIIRGPTIPVRPHCPWCQQVAHWEHIARMADTQAKEIKNISASARYHAEKLREHGCPPPPPPPPPQ